MKKLLSSLLAVPILVIPSGATAQTSLPIAKQFDFYSLTVIDKPSPAIVKVEPKETKPPVETPKPQPVIYIVVSGDNLTKIGTAYNVEWQRLWAKNTQLTHPDLIHPGDKITIPEPSEQLNREIPAQVSLPAVTPNAAPVRNYSGGNSYDYGYCTWYVKDRRGASLPNGLGNANTWYSRASGMGMVVGSEPRAGAVGTTTRGALGHVVYVERVNGDGTIYISEMNAPTWGAVTYRTASAGEFIYIY